MNAQAKVVQFPTTNNTSLALDDALTAKLDRYMILKAAAAEYEQIKKELKAVFQGTETITIGKYTVTGKTVNMPAKKVPAFSYWDIRIKTAN